jgi:hypothetical protein
MSVFSYYSTMGQALPESKQQLSSHCHSAASATVLCGTAAGPLCMHDTRHTKIWHGGMYVNFGSASLRPLLLTTGFEQHVYPGRTTANPCDTGRSTAKKRGPEKVCCMKQRHQVACIACCLQDWQSSPAQLPSCSSPQVGAGAVCSAQGAAATAALQQQHECCSYAAAHMM